MVPENVQQRPLLWPSDSEVLGTGPWRSLERFRDASWKSSLRMLEAERLVSSFVFLRPKTQSPELKERGFVSVQFVEGADCRHLAPGEGGMAEGPRGAKEFMVLPGRQKAFFPGTIGPSLLGDSGRAREARILTEMQTEKARLGRFQLGARTPLIIRCSKFQSSPTFRLWRGSPGSCLQIFSRNQEQKSRAQ